MGKEIVKWHRKEIYPTLSRKCPCCKSTGVGYLIGSNGDRLFCIWIRKEYLYLLMREFYSEFKEPFCLKD